MAIQALAPYYNENEAVQAAVDKGVRCLSALQQEDGSYAGEYGASAECNAQVIVALTALGIHPHTDVRFVKNGRSVVDALSAYYVSGTGFRHEAGEGADYMATEQGYYALAAYNRFLNGQSSLWDMSDVTLQKAEPVNPGGTEPAPETGMDNTTERGSTEGSGAAATSGAGRQETPSTGDEAPIAGYRAASLLSMLALAVLLAAQARRRQK